MAKTEASSKHALYISEDECVERPLLPDYKDGNDLALYVILFEKLLDDYRCIQSRLQFE